MMKIQPEKGICKPPHGKHKDKDRDKGEEMDLLMEIETVQFIVKHPHDKHKDRDKDKDEDKDGSPDDDIHNDKYKDEDKEVSPDENTECSIHCQTLPGRMHREL